ncbi:MAG: hypothetical protein K2M73_11420 [Lachnospiraceae bacterium]|nr:hypothetical protein [Lachnospiraceae bacterium]
MKNKDIIKSKKREQRIYKLLVSLLIFLIFILFMVFVPMLVNTIIGIREKDRLNNNIIRMKEEYGIDIYYADNISDDVQCKYKLSGDIKTNNDAIDDIYIIMSRLPYDVWLEMTEYNRGEEIYYGRVIIFLCDSIEDTVAGRIEGIENEDGFSIALKVSNNSNIKTAFAHELFHRLDTLININTWLNYDKEFSYGKWDGTLPEDYEYLKRVNGNDNKDERKRYTIYGEDDINNIYFVSTYSQKSREEDMAEVFSYLLATGVFEDLPEAYNSPHVKEKAKLIVDMIAETFDCVDENAYWTRVYREKVANN